MNTGHAVRALLMTAALPFAAFADDATEAAPVPIGSRVRITTRDGKESTGLLSAWKESGVVLIDESGRKRQAIDRAAIASLDRSIARGSRMIKGALVGGLVGAALPLLAGASCSNCDIGSQDLFSITGAYTVPIGALLGGALGSGLSTDAWEKVDVAGTRSVSLSLALTPAPGKGAGVSVRLSWR